MTGELKQQIADAFDIRPEDRWLLEPSREQVQLKLDRERHAVGVAYRYQELADELSVLLPPGMEWVVE